MPVTKSGKSRLVYSTQCGRLCPSCGQTMVSCQCATVSNRPVTDGIVRLQRQTKGRKGKGVTLITGIPLDSKSLVNLSKQLKKKCGTGGTVKGGIIEI